MRENIKRKTGKNYMKLEIIAEVGKNWLINKDISIEETKCVHKGGDCHEYVVKWS